MEHHHSNPGQGQNKTTGNREQGTTQQETEVERLRREKQALERKYEKLKGSEYRYRMIFDLSYVSIWEEDYSQVYKLLSEIKQSGVEDLEKHLKTHPKILRELTQRIRVLDVNNATLKMYNAGSKEEFLGSLDKVFVADSKNSFIHEMCAVANGAHNYEGETVGKKLTGEHMDLLLRITVPEEEGEGDYSNVLVSIIDITDRKQRERENTRLYNLAESLRTTTLALTASLNQDEIIDIVLREVGKNIKYTSVSLWLYAEDHFELFRHRSDFQIPLPTDILKNELNNPASLFSQKLKIKREPLLYSDTQKADRFPIKKNVRSFLAMPIIVRNSIVGIINFCGDTPGMFTQNTLDTLELYIHSTAVALENSRLYSEAQKEINERKRVEEEIRRSLEEKEILLMEVHHRVKNNLNIVASLLNLQAEQIDTVEHAREALHMSQARVHSMAMVHENLYQSSEFSRVDMANYIKNIVEELVRVYAHEASVELDIQAEKIALTITKAVPLGLLLNELITNSLIHGFSDSKHGQLSAYFYLSTQDECILEVKDNGKGFPEATRLQKNSSLGLQLIEILTEQLKGEAHFNHENGTSFTLTFPLSNR